MANELTASVGISFAKEGMTSPAGSNASAPVGLSIPPTQFTITGDVWSEGTVLASFTTPTAVPLGAVTEPHWSLFWNLDEENSVEVRSSDVGDPIANLEPGEFCLVPLDIAAVPHLLADTADVLVKYLIVSL